MHRLLLVPVLSALLTGAAILPAFGRVRLTTLPDREAVTVRFEDDGSVLVEEERTLTLAQGKNTIDFTWAGVQIRRDSIQMLPVEGPQVTVIRTTFPRGEPSSLVWEVSSATAGAARVRISYLLDGLSRETALRAVLAEGDAPRLGLRVEHRLSNASGEDFDPATLAAWGGSRVAALRDGMVRQTVAARYTDLPFERRYIYDPRESQGVAVQLAVANDGQALDLPLLPAGKVRIFQAGPEGETFLGEDWTAAVPRGGEMLLKTGEIRDLTVRRALLSTRDEVVQRDKDDRPALWHQDSRLRWEVENFSGGTRKIRLVEHTNGEWEILEPRQVLERRLAPEKYEPAVGEEAPATVLERHDADTLHATVVVPAGRRIVLELTLRRRNLH